MEVVHLHLRRILLAALVAAALLALLLGSAPAQSAPACETTWQSQIGGTWDNAANWTNGVPDATKVACVTQPGTYTIFVTDDRSAEALILGAPSGTQTLQLKSTTNESNVPVTVTFTVGAGSEIRSSGVLEMTSDVHDPLSPAQPGEVRLVATGGPLSNAGIIRSQPGKGGQRLFSADINNGPKGQIEINTDSCECFSHHWFNEGSLKVAAQKRLTFTGVSDGATFTNSNGTVTTTGTIRMLDGLAAFEGGTISGSDVELCDTDLSAPGSGSASYAFIRDADAACSGGRLIADVGPGVTVKLRNPAGSGGPVEVSQPGPITNDGALVMTGAGESRLTGGQPLANAGSLTVDGTGARVLDVVLSNLNGGLVQINSNACQCTTRTWTNQGTFNVAAGATLTLAGFGNGPTFVQSSGSMGLPGTLFLKRGFFTHNGGPISGSPVKLCGSTLDPGGPGTAAFEFLRDGGQDCGGGTISSEIAAGETIRINNVTAQEMVVSVGSPLTNDGTILVTGSGAARLTGEKLTNSGALTLGGTGARALDLNLDNAGDGTVSVNTDACQCTGKTWTSTGALNIAVDTELRLNSVALQADPPVIARPVLKINGGTVANQGRLLVQDGTLEHQGGNTTGSPLQACSSTVVPGGTGTAAIDFVNDETLGCGGGVLGGDIAAGETVRLLGTGPGALAVGMPANRTNRGAILMEGPGATHLLGGFALTNHGTFTTTGLAERRLAISLLNRPAGTFTAAADTCECGTQTWINQGTLTVAAGRTLRIQGEGAGATFNQLAGALNVNGTLDLDGAEPDENGTMTASGGTITVAKDGRLRLSTDLPLSGGTLRGTGTVKAPAGVVNSGGTVKPGASPGTLTIDGSYTQGENGTLAIDVAGSQPGSGYSQLLVIGAASLGGTLSVTTTVAPTSPPRILTATSRTGEFEEPWLLTGRFYVVGYDDTGVLLNPIPAPVNEVEPAISGAPDLGSELTCSPGTWDDDPPEHGPTAFSFAWARDDALIPSATSNEYTVAEADRGHSLSCRVTAVNDGGETTARSDEVDVAAPVVIPTPEPPKPPANTGVPSITGTPAVFETLSCSQGAWTEAPTAFAYAWSVDGAAIPGAASASYVVTIDDAGRALTCTVTAANSTGVASATSAPLAVAEACVVPKLRGSTLAAARKKLTRANCRLGKVTKPRKRPKRARLVVRRQSVPDGDVRRADARVGVTLRVAKKRT